MVMGFQDEIDDEDYLRPSHLNHPVVAQISDSSDEELEETPQPDRTAPTVHKVTQSLEDLSDEDDLDDWLNGGSEQSIKPKSSSAAVVAKKNDIVSSVNTTRPNAEPKVDDYPVEPSLEAIGKSSKKVKEKKSKRKPKKSSKERSCSPCHVGTDAIEQSRPYDDEYEEI